MKLEGKECSSENLNLTPTGDLHGRCLSFIIPLKDTSYCSREDPVGTPRPDSRNREIQVTSGRQVKRFHFTRTDVQ